MYQSGTGTELITFRYTVEAAMTSADLDFNTTSALLLNGGTMLDAAGNTANLSLVGVTTLATANNIVIDTTLPTTPTEDGTADKNNTTQSANFNIIVNAETDGVVTATEDAADVINGAPTSITAVVGKATLPIDITQLEEGANNIVITVTDAAGNASATLTVAVTKDTTAPDAPTVVAVAPVGGTTVANTLNTTNTNMTASATITANQAVGGHAELLVGGVVKATDAVIATDETTVTFTLGTADNTALQAAVAAGGEVTVKLYDVVNNNQTSSVGNPTLVVDYTAPATPTEDGSANKEGTTQNVDVNIIVTDENGAVITATVDGIGNVLDTVAFVTADASGTSTLPIDIAALAQGSNDIEIIVTDNHGNPSATLTVTVTKDTAAPTGTVATQSVQGGATVTVQSSEIGDAYLVPSGTLATACDEVAELNALLGATATTVAIAAANTNTTILAPATEGTYKLVVVDELDQVSGMSAEIVTVDDTAPAFNGGTPAAGAILATGATPTITYDDNTATLLIYKHALGGAARVEVINAVDADASYQIANVGGAGDGIYVIKITDVAGNSSERVIVIGNAF